MQRTLIGILSLLCSLFLFAVPASAVNLPQCGGFNLNGSDDFTLVGQDNAIFEGGNPTSSVINGNVLVTNPNPVNVGSATGTGFVKLGPNVKIFGTVTAHTIMFPGNGSAAVSKCVADVITGDPGVNSGPTCRTSLQLDASGNGGIFVPNIPLNNPNASLFFTDFAAANPTCVNPDTAPFGPEPSGTLTLSPATTPLPAFASLCGPTPVVAPCANVAEPLTVAEGATVTNPTHAAPNPTCFGALVLEKGAVLNLTGTYTFKSIRMKAGSRLNGPATVNVNGQLITEPGVFITDITLSMVSSQGDVVALFNNSVLTRVIINAPFGRCHPHTGTALQCSEICCKSLDIEPITAVCDTPQEVCVCPDGFRFQDLPLVAVFNNSPALATDRNCVRCQAGDGPPCP